MSLLLAGTVGAAAGLGTATAASYGNSLIGNYFSNKSSKDNYERSYEWSLASGLADSQLSRRDYKWYQNADYEQSKLLSEYEYDLSRRYAENSAKWTVTGLRNAGLNPILAATNGNLSSTYGSGVQSATPSSSSSGIKPLSTHTYTGATGSGVDVIDSALKWANALNAETDKDIKQETKDSLVSSAKSDAATKAAQVDIADATADKIRADARLTDANTAKTLVDTDNASDTAGVNSFAGLAATVLKSMAPDFRSSNTARKDVSNHLSDYYRQIEVNSAKSRAEATRREREQRNKRERQAAAEIERIESDMRKHISGGRRDRHSSVYTR